MISMWQSLALGGGLFAAFMAGCFITTARRLNRVRRSDRFKGDHY